MSRSKRRFGEYSPAGRAAIALLFVASVGLVAFSERDLQRRPADQVWGSKAIWRLICLNALGAASYLRWGRRAASDR